VTTRRWMLSLLSVAMVSALAGCGGGSTFDVQNPPPPPPPNLSIAFQPAPPGSIPINTTTTLTAVVSNDPSNAGVDWSVTCQNPKNCGSLSALHSSSGDTLTFTPPLAISGNSETISIVAFATADHTTNVVAPIAVTAFGTNLKGNYVLQAQGIDSSLGAYQFAGVVSLDGNGGIVNGEQTANFFDDNANALVSKSDAITGGNYFVGPDGRGTITINTADQDVGQNGIETFSLVFLSNAHVLIAQTDSTESATGTMDLQASSITTPTGGYAFVVSGTDIASFSPTSFGGVFNIDSPNTISGNGSTTDQNLAGIVTAKQQLFGTLSNPDSFGAFTLNLTAGFVSTPIQFIGYIVDGTHINLIESDNPTGVGTGSTGGVAIGQGSATGTFLDDSAFSGTFVSGVLGVDLNGFTPDTFTSVSLLSADGSGNIVNGFTDTFLQQSGAQGNSGAQISAAFAGSYSVDNKGTGRVQTTFTHFAPRPTPAYQPRFFFYLTGNGNPPLVLDGGDLNYPSVGSGIAYPQSVPPFIFNGDYGFSVVQQNGSENDGTGQMTADAGSLTGVVDLNSGFSISFNNAFSGSFVPPASNGRFAGTLFNPAVAVEHYIVDRNRGFFVETDLVDPNVPTGQVSFGFYEARTPVCEGCP
jgi:hypothetical protein